ncbi:NADPH:adrenodoxin oxidoreductase [Paragonimus kellicotti]|nr:NADPH:adrenodoxin oxidoreductase [Paragonimus kellicotti]
MFEKLPAPFGLIRYGVAPDHPDVKNVINTFTEVARSPRFNFVGNVTVGKDLRLHELQRAYCAVILAYGASVDRRLKIPGEDLEGVLSAKDLVGWYNGAPSLSNFQPDLNCDTVAVVGIGNVALDVARILLSSTSRLQSTDIPEPVMSVLHASKIRRVVIIGRRGPLQVAFTLKEIRELSRLEVDGDGRSPSSLPIRLLPEDVLQTCFGTTEQVDLLLSGLWWCFCGFCLLL